LMAEEHPRRSHPPVRALEAYVNRPLPPRRPRPLRRSGFTAYAGGATPSGCATLRGGGSEPSRSGRDVLHNNFQAGRGLVKAELFLRLYTLWYKWVRPHRSLGASPSLKAER
ncbi:MAG: hypothetical protein QW057_03625, partial [Candidatus Bathyarchaeia archaeon]